MTASVPDRRTGPAAVAAGVLLFASVAAELLWPVQDPDGSLTGVAGFVLYLGAWTIGAGCLVAALVGLGGAVRSRAGRAGRGLGVVGAVLFTAFGALTLATALLDGAPAEWAFLLFAVGLLLLVVGSFLLAPGLRGALGTWWGTLLLAGVGGLVALGASVDPWHDLGLFAFDAAWVTLGLRLLATPAAVRV